MIQRFTSRAEPLDAAALAGRRPRLATALAAVAAAATLAFAILGTVPPRAVLAHAPDPLFGSEPWAQDQIVGYQWAAGAVPPAWMAAAIDAGAQDVAESRQSRAATFTRIAKADSKIWYGGAWPCPAYGIACVNRTGAPDSFTGMWFRPHGFTFDWGVLRWCQGLAAPANGCYDVENVALDEFGHIEILGHHVNFADESDFTDAVVQYAARSRPRVGWNEHAFGRCDVARLQLEYELIMATDPVSTCLALQTSLAIIPGSTWISPGQSVRVSGTLNVKVATAARALSGDPLSGRAVTLQRRLPGTTTWSAAGALDANAAAGSYGLTITPAQTYDYRLVYTVAGEGLVASTSSVVRIVVSSCPGGTVAGGGVAGGSMTGGGAAGGTVAGARQPMAPCEY